MKLFVLDMDGTLLNQHHVISRENKDAIVETIKQGNQVAIATGRHYLGAKRILDESGLSLPIIANNGGTIHLNDQQIHAVTMPTFIARDVLMYIDNNDITAMVSTTDGLFVLHETVPILESEMPFLEGEQREQALRLLQIRKSMSLKQELYKPYHNHYDILMGDFSIYKIFVFSFLKPKLYAMKEHFLSYQKLAMTSSGRNNVEFMPYGVEKGSSVRMLGEQLGVSLKDTIVIGDNENDLSMFTIAGTSVAMGNAEEFLKKVATLTTKSNKEDGVAYAIRMLS